jgi:hypothetical protein
MALDTEGQPPEIWMTYSPRTGADSMLGSLIIHGKSKGRDRTASALAVHRPMSVCEGGVGVVKAKPGWVYGMERETSSQELS